MKNKNPVGAPTKYNIPSVEFRRQVPQDVIPEFNKILALREKKKRILTRNELREIWTIKDVL